MTNTQSQPESRGSSQHELCQPSALLDEQGNLVQVGWARQPLLNCNLENARFYALRPLQRFRIKRWDYYGITTPTHYLSFTIFQRESPQIYLWG